MRKSQIFMAGVLFLCGAPQIVLAQNAGGRVWSAGVLNGLPEDEYAALSDARPGRVQGKVVSIREPAAFPQVIEPGQSFVVRLEDVPRAHLVLRLAVTGRARPPGQYLRLAVTGRARPPGQYSDYYGQRRLRILFNDREIWRRWHVEGHTLLQTSGADALNEKGIAVRQAWDASIGPGPAQGHDARHRRDGRAGQRG